MMVARSGLFVAPAPGPAGTTPADARLAFSALIGTTPQPASGGAITQSASAMQFTVTDAVWQLPDFTNAKATFLSPTDPITLSTIAGPGTGSRVDLLVVKQNNIENSDADSRVNVSLVQGTAGSPGVAPAVPAGAYLYATINVPTGAANAAACTVVIARPTTFGALPIKSPTLALLNTVAGSFGQHGYVSADTTVGNNGDYIWNGTGWFLSYAQSTTAWITPTLTAGWSSGGAPWFPFQYRMAASGEVEFRGQLTPRSGYANTEAFFTLPTGFRPISQLQLPCSINSSASPQLAGVSITSAGAMTITPTGAANVNLGYLNFATN